MISLYQVIYIICASFFASAFIFYLVVKSLMKSLAETHVTYYKAIRDYIEKNEENYKMIIDLLSIDSVELD